MAFDVGAQSGRPAPQINVTPLVDVVLVLLIIFMVVTPLLTKKFWLHVPKKDETTEAPPPPPDDANRQLVLRLEKDGRIRVNSQDVAKGELGMKLKRALSARRDGLVFFDADNEAPYADAVELMDVARGSGASTIAVLTQELAQ
jgi:biopolymer transport protein ExbD